MKLWTSLPIWILAVCLTSLLGPAAAGPAGMQLLATYEVGGAGIDVAWSPDGAILAAASGDNITLLDPFTGEVYGTMTPSNGSIRSIGWSPDGSRIAFSAGTPPYVAIWNTADATAPADARTFAASHFAWSPDGNQVAVDWSGAPTYNLSILDVGNGSLARSIPTNGKSVDALEWSPDGLRLAAVLDRTAIHVWNVTNETSFSFDPTGWFGTITSIRWSPDGQHLLAGMNDSFGHFNLRLVSGTEGWQVGGSSYNASATNGIAWSPDGVTIASGQEDGSIYLSGFDGGWIDATLLGQQPAAVTSLDWSPNGKFLAAASPDGTVRLWGVPGSIPQKRGLRVTVSPDRPSVVGGESVNLTVRLRLDTLEPVSGATLSFSSSGGGSFSPAVDAGDGNYTARFTTAEVRTGTTVTLAVNASRMGYLAANGSLALRVLPPPVVGRTVVPVGPAVGGTEAAAAAAGGTILLVAAGLALTETGRYSGMVLIIPLFTRMKKTTVLDNFTRGQLHGYIVANPGVHMNAIRDRFELSNGEVAYHLRVLERECLVSSMSDGLRRRFYPGERSSRERPQELTFAQNLLVTLMEKNPGITGTELAKLTDTSPQVVNYHLKKLWRLDLISMDREGRLVRCFVKPERLRLFNRGPVQWDEAQPEEARSPQ